MSFDNPVPKKRRSIKKTPPCIFIMITSYSHQLTIVGLHTFINGLFNLFIYFKNVYKVDPFPWLMIIRTIVEYLPWAHKYQLSFLFYHRDHHRNCLKKNGKTQQRHSNFFTDIKLVPIHYFYKRNKVFNIMLWNE